MSECNGDSEYLCTYSQLCISSLLRCNGDANCGHHDDTDEGHCEFVPPVNIVSLAGLFSRFLADSNRMSQVPSPVAASPSSSRLPPPHPPSRSGCSTYRPHSYTYNKDCRGLHNK